MTKVFNQLTVGELIKKLEYIFDQNQPLAFCKGLYPADFWSYRGYYEDLAIGVTTFPVTVGGWLAKLKEQIGKEHYGWKGGTYTVCEDTAVWVAVEHRDTGPAITDVKPKDGWVKLSLTHDD